MKKFKRFFIHSVLLIFILGSIFASIGAGVLYSFYKQLPYVSLESYEQSINSKIYDEKGKLILELFKNENRTRKVGLSEISDHFLNAVVSIEDKKFYNHHGIDIKRIIKSMLLIIKTGEIKSGGSTITQQLARNAFLTLERRWSRKIKEIMLAFKLEKQFTKDEILALYVNEISYGGLIYGIESASNYYFGKHASELSIDESALLAGMINAVTYYNPITNYDKSIKRRDLVLREMFRDGKITKDEYLNAKNKKTEIVGNSKDLCIAPYYIYSHLLPYLKTKYGENMVNSGGMKIYTTINSEIQKIAEEEFAKAEIFKEYPDLTGGMLVVEVKTGKLLAVVGGKEFSGTDQFNRAFQAVRQPGSLMKPIVYLTAFDNGIPANKIFSDVPREYFDPWTQTIWQPHNYEGRYHGPVILRMALENSYNIVAIELLKEIGAKNVIANSQKLGIDSHLRETLSLALGAYSVNPTEMAQAYSVFANSGIKVNLSNILKVTDPNGFELEKYKYEAKKVFPATSVAILNNILTDAVKRGSGTRARIKGYTIAGKTGTTDDFTNAWFCGYTPNLLIVSYLGYDMPATIGNHCSGGRITAPIVKNVMEKIFKRFPERFPPEEFPEPDGLNKVKICRESGLLATEDCSYVVDTLFHKGTEPKMKCNFHNPEILDFDEIDTTEIQSLFETAPKNTIFTEPTKKTITKKSEKDKSLERLKNELNFFND